MGASYDSIPDSLIKWLVKQQMFWVATAALIGHVNVSPKSTPDCFHIVHKNKVWYEDLTGSGQSPISRKIQRLISPLQLTVNFFKSGWWHGIVPIQASKPLHTCASPETGESRFCSTRSKGARRFSGYGELVRPILMAFDSIHPDRVPPIHVPVICCDVRG